MKKLLYLLSLLILLPSYAMAQGVAYHDIALYNSSGFAKPVASAVITVCSASDPSIPCTTKVSIYSNYALTTAKANPFNADLNGNFNFIAASGNYTITVTGVGVSGYSNQVTLGGSGGGGGGTISGSIATGQVAVGSAANTISGSNGFMYDPVGQSFNLGNGGGPQLFSDGSANWRIGFILGDQLFGTTTSLNLSVGTGSKLLFSSNNTVNNIDYNGTTGNLEFNGATSGTTTVGVTAVASTLNISNGIATGGTPPIALMAGVTGGWGAANGTTACTPTAGASCIRAVSGGYNCSLDAGADSPCLPVLPASVASGDLPAWSTTNVRVLTDSGVNTSALITKGVNTSVVIGSGTSIGSTLLCSSATCPAGTYVVNAYVDITTACGTSGTYIVNLIYTDDQGSKTIPININGTGSVPATGVLTTTSTANFGENAQVLRLTSGNLNYSTTATACGSAGPMVGNLYLQVLN